ncbi:MAG: FAD-binding oxidoreductase [Planctomycetes bacterium]|nr:FAD-binding oxidoreductase [Planctomycetota bacterium]
MTQRVNWWRWGDPAHRFEPPPDFLTCLFERLGVAPRPKAPEPAPPRLPDRTPVLDGLPHETDDAHRLAHAGGRSYLDLVRLRRGSLEHAPDAVLYPATAEEVGEILRRADCAVVPFGGGTSVVGGVAPARGSHRGVATLDLTRLSRLLEVDRESLLARVECGIMGPALESELARHGLTLGHFPQSFEYSTLGGWIATRSAGQASGRYGRIEDMVAGLRAITPAGEIVTRAVPASASGPEVRELLVGSEGTLGVIVEATLRVHPIPESRAFASYLFPSFEAGLRAIRRMAQEGPAPAIVRLSDVVETEAAMKLADADRSFGLKLLRFLGRSPGAHLMLGFEGGDGKHARVIARREGGFGVGAGPGERWDRERFRHPYLRDALLDYGLLVETLETATSWSNVPRLYTAVRGALSGLILCHVSHVYSDGASLYFTVIADAPRGEEEERWTRMKEAACDALVSNGGTISHHHGVGADHRAWLVSERGELAVKALRAMKGVLDPRGILNPGKLHS